MAKILVLATLVLQLFCVLLEVSGQPPCSRYFKYITNSSTREVMGQIEIPYPPKDINLQLRVLLSFPPALIAVRPIPSIYPKECVAQIELAQSRKASVQAVQQGEPLVYHIRFPLQQALHVNEIWFNQRLYCRDTLFLMSLMKPLIYLSHKLCRPNTEHGMCSQKSKAPVNHCPGFFPPLPTYQPDRYPIETTKRPIMQHPIDNTILNRITEDCGRSTDMNNINRRISKGEKVWPWVVTLFMKRIEFEYLCTGSILTNRHILTAAHCCKQHRTHVNILPDLMLVSLGQHNLGSLRGSVNHEVAYYSLHPDYVFHNGGDSDLALLVLKDPVEFSSKISPVCLWSGPDTLQSVVDKSGYMMRWVGDKQNFIVPRIIKMPIVSQEDCLRSNPEFVPNTSKRTFCAGSRDGIGPCNGDSGSGLVLLNTTTGRFQLRGIVVLSLLDEDMNCDLKQYIVFVDVAKYIHWIKQQISIT